MSDYDAAFSSALKGGGAGSDYDAAMPKLGQPKPQAQVAHPPDFGGMTLQFGPFDTGFIFIVGLST